MELTAIRESFKKQLETWQIPTYQRPYYNNWLASYVKFVNYANINYSNPASVSAFLQDLSKREIKPFQYEQAKRAAEWCAGKEGRAEPEKSGWEEALEQLSIQIKVRHYSPRTLEIYEGWVKRFRRFVENMNPAELTSDHAQRFLKYLAIEKRISSATQNQAFNSLLFLYREVLKKEYRILETTPRGKRTRNAPNVLSREEVGLLLENMAPAYKLVAQLMYGCGLRLGEASAIRVKDMDLDQGKLYIRKGKGAKDRILPLPQVLKEELAAQLKRVREQYQADIGKGFGGVFLPQEIENKFHGRARDFAWYWFFPAKSLTRETKTGEMKRYHLHPTNIYTAIRDSANRAGIARRVTPHALRHSFATHILRAGYDIRVLQDLMGHGDVRTTMIYTHTITADAKPVKSPLDFPSGVRMPDPS